MPRWLKWTLVAIAILVVLSIAWLLVQTLGSTGHKS